MTKVEINKFQKRQALMQGAYELFTTIGFHKTTILGISIKAGVGKGTFYTYFKDKEDIRDCIIAERSYNILKASITALMEHEKTLPDNMSLTDEMIFITDFILDYMDKNRDELEFISKNLGEGELFKNPSNSDEPDNGAVLNLRNYVADIIRSRNIKLKDPEIMVFTLLELVNSTCYNIIIKQRPTDLESYKPYLYKIVALIINNALE